MIVDVRAVLTQPDPEPPWLVPDFLCQSAIVILAGEAGAGKSVFTYSLAIALATGTSFMGWKLKESRVLYLDEENSPHDQNGYIRWAYFGLGSPNMDKVVQNVRFGHFAVSDDPLPWDAALKQQVADFQPDLVVIDTATPACRLDDENDNAEATNAVVRIRHAKRATVPSCAVLILKHARLDKDTGKYGVRGASAWVGATDSTMVFTKVGKGRPRADGLFRTRITSLKTRLYGFRGSFDIVPHLTGTPPFQGLALERTATPPEPEK